jgi:hypothetical protein
MFERRLLILKYMGKTPFLATCERCHLKFFTPTQLNGKPVEAEQNLQERFDIHKCRPEDVEPRNVLMFGHRRA